MNNDKKEREFLNTCQKLIDEYHIELFRAKTSDILIIANEFYCKLKHISYQYYKNQELPYNYRHLADKIINMERFIPPHYIFEYPHHDFSKNLEMPRTLNNSEVVLDYLADQTRKYLLKEISFGYDFGFFESFDLLGECIKATEFANYTTAKIGIQSWKVTICPNFDSSKRKGVHTFLLVLINGESYILDCTYSQFFTKLRCNLNRLGVPLLVGPAPGAFMQMTEERQKVAMELLTRGWIKCTPDRVKTYLDGFMLSYRNGLYYERTKDFSFEVPYNAECYEDFINGFDNLYNYENKEELDFQLSPLSNPDMLIRHRTKS